MKYLEKSFTLPTSNNISQMRWDFAFLTKEEFMDIYNLTDYEYECLKMEELL